MRTIRVYDLYDGPKGPSAQSQYYDRISRTVYQVAAVSIKQAVYLCAKHVWHDGGMGPGILAIKNSDQEWSHWDGTQDYNAHYKHYQVFRGTKPKVTNE